MYYKISLIYDIHVKVDSEVSAALAGVTKQMANEELEIVISQL